MNVSPPLTHTFPVVRCVHASVASCALLVVLNHCSTANLHLMFLQAVIV